MHVGCGLLTTSFLFKRRRGEQRAATLTLALRNTALLSAPRCGVAPGSRGTRVKSGSAAAAAALVANAAAAGAAGACCARCSGLEQCGRLDGL